MSIEHEKIKNIIEAALFAADKPMSIDQILALFDLDELPERADLKKILATLEEEYQARGIELKQVSSGYRFQVRQQYSHWVSKLWEEKPPRYTRALLETLALITYRQPITRAEIEDVRGVAVSSNIMKTLQERDWVKVVGHRDVPGRPALFATTKDFLDYFNLKSMDELPTLAEIKDLDKIGEGLSSGDEIPEVATNSEIDNEGDSDTVNNSNVDSDIKSDTDSDFDTDIDSYIENEGEINTQEDSANAINDVEEDGGDNDVDENLGEDLSEDRDEGDADFSALGDGVDKENLVSNAVNEKEVVEEEASSILEIQSENNELTTTANENVHGKTVEDVVINSDNKDVDESVKKSASSDYEATVTVTEGTGTLLN